MNIAKVAGHGLSEELKSKLERVSSATITSQLQIRGYQNCFLNKLKPLNDGQKMVGVARTLRYLPSRPDIWDMMGRDVQRETIEMIQPGEVLVIDARNEPDAGTIGDIYALRAKMLGAAGVITDGALRDTPAIQALNIPVYHQTSNGATLGRKHASVDAQIPVACGGATVFPGDIIVGDSEGAVVIPRTMAEEIADASIEMETEENFVLKRVGEGASTVGYFPLEPENQPEYKEWLDTLLEE